MSFGFILPLDKEISLLKIYVIAGMSTNEFIGEFSDPVRLKMKINAIPEDGKANKEIISFLAKTLKITKADIEMIRGETSRNKDLKIHLSTEELNLKLAEKISDKINK